VSEEKAPTAGVRVPIAVPSMQPPVMLTASEVKVATFVLVEVGGVFGLGQAARAAPMPSSKKAATRAAVIDLMWTCNLSVAFYLCATKEAEMDTDPLLPAFTVLACSAWVLWRIGKRELGWRLIHCWADVVGVIWFWPAAIACLVFYFASPARPDAEEMRLGGELLVWTFAPWAACRAVDLACLGPLIRYRARRAIAPPRPAGVVDVMPTMAQPQAEIGVTPTTMRVTTAGLQPVEMPIPARSAGS
jgi:hypothetical protein